MRNDFYVENGKALITVQNRENVVSITSTDKDQETTLISFTKDEAIIFASSILRALEKI